MDKFDNELGNNHVAFNELPEAQKSANDFHVTHPESHGGGASTRTDLHHHIDASESLPYHETLITRNADSPKEQTQADATTLINGIKRIAILHTVPTDTSSINEISVRDETRPDNQPNNNILLQRGLDTELPEGISPDRASLLRNEKLEGTRSVILAEGQRLLDEGTSGFSWAVMAMRLLNAAEQNQDAFDRDVQLASAIAVSQFSDTEDRLQLVREIYGKGIESMVAAACATSPLVLMTGGPSMPDYDPTSDGPEYVVRPIASFTEAFRMAPADITRLLPLYEQPGSQLVDIQASRRKHKMQKEIASQVMEGEIDESTRIDAMETSVASEKVGGEPTIIDLRKVERFGLRSIFIKEQAAALFGTTVDDVVNSRFSRRLASHHATPTEESETGTLSELEMVHFVTKSFEDDIRATFTELSGPIVERFKIEDLDPSNPNLTSEQKASVRYGDVVAFFEQSNVLLKYLGVNNISETSPGESIWSVSENGAAVPTSSQQALETVLKAALKLKNQGILLRPEKIYKELQTKRLSLLRIASQNLAEVGPVVEHLFDSAEFKLEEDGEYHLSLPTTAPAKDTLDVYAAITLGCPALREIHQSRSLLTSEEKAAHGSANYIDHALASSFKEAFDRGILDVNNYNSQQGDPSEVVGKANG